MTEKSKIKKEAGNENLECVSISNRYGDERVIIHALVQEDQKARMSAIFCEKWAMVAAELAGEDSAGRQRVRRLTPDELALHACETVESLYREWEARGWLFAVPPYESIFEEKKKPAEGE